MEGRLIHNIVLASQHARLVEQARWKRINEDRVYVRIYSAPLSELFEADKIGLVRIAVFADKSVVVGIVGHEIVEFDAD